MGRKVTGADGVEFDLDEAIARALANANPESKADNAVQTLVGQLMQDNFDYRRRISELKSKTETLDKEGVKVLSKEEATVYEQYIALGKPEELKATVDKHTELQNQMVEMQFDNAITTAAEVNGYKKHVLRDIVKANNLSIVVKDHDFTENGKTVTKPAAFVVDSTTKGEKLLPEVLKEKFSDYLPALEKESAVGGRPWISQESSSGKPGTSEKSIFDAFKDSVYGDKAKQHSER